MSQKAKVLPIIIIVIFSLLMAFNMLDRAEEVDFIMSRHRLEIEKNMAGELERKCMTGETEFCFEN